MTSDHETPQITADPADPFLVGEPPAGAFPAQFPAPGDGQALLGDSVYDVVVRVQAVLARRQITVSELLAITPGSIIALEKRVGEPIEIMVNDRLIGRGELVRVDDGIGVTMTEIIRQER
jgi:flagellar motor switch protein FliN